MTLNLLLAGKEKLKFQCIKDALADEDINIIVATSIGLAIFLARKNRPHLIISQEELADSDAISFFYELRCENDLAEIPFVILSEMAAQEVDANFRFNANKLISKAEQPFSLPANWLSSDIKQKVRALMGK